MKLIPNIYRLEYNVVLFTLTTLFGILVSYFQYNIIKQELDANLEIQNTNIHKTFHLSLQTLKTELELKSNGILALSGVKEAILNQDREKLYSFVKKPFQQITTHNKYVKIVTFRNVDGSTLLRVHKPEMFGDKLNQKRKIILDAINSKKRQYGFEVGKLELAYRVVTPVIYEKKLLGVLEIGVNPEYITTFINSIFDIKMALLVNKQDLSINQNAKEIKSIKNFSFIRGDELFKEHIGTLDLNKNYIKVLYKSSEYYVNPSFDLEDNRQNIAAKILIAYNLDSFNRKVTHLLQINLLITFILLLFLLFGFNHFTKKIRKTYASIKKRDDILAMQSRMASMGEMLESIAHQWRQPLSLISTSSTGMILKKEYDILSDKELIENLESINNASQHLSQTIDDFRNFYNHDKETSEFNIKSTIEKSLSLVSSQLQNRNIDVVNRLKDKRVLGFENELIQVFINIINNAKDALEESEQKKKIIMMSMSFTQNEVSLYFQDNAGGITEDALPKIFDHKFTTKAHKNGTGIGLYMSKLIIKKSQGSIKAHNNEFVYKKQTYRGSCFTITLPCK